MVGTGTRRPRTGRVSIKCGWCGSDTPTGSQSHERTTCSDACMRKLASKRAHMKVDIDAMTIQQTATYLGLLEQAETAVKWEANVLRKLAKSMLSR